jgi:hypothetical protein
LPSWPAAPTGGEVLPTGGAPEDGGGNPWGGDIAGTVADAITAFVAKVVAQTSGPVFDLLGRTVLATPDLTHQAQVRALWTACLVAADTGFVLFIVIAGVQLAARETVQTRYGFKQLIPRLLVGMIAANCALPVIAQAITLTNAVTAAVTHEALDTTTTHAAVHQIATQALHQHNFLESCLELGIIVLAVAVLLSFVARLAILILLIAGSPLALACFALPQTDGVARLWCRAIGGVLGIQIAQAVTLVALARVFLTPRAHLLLGFPTDANSLINLLVAITLLWIMCKIPGWVRRLVFRQPLTLLPGRPHLVPRTVSRVVKAVVITKTLGALGVFGHRTAGHAATRPHAASTGPRVRRAPGARPAAARPARRTGTTRPTPARPAPAGPAAFSHAPVTQTPLPGPAGYTGPPAFSHAPAPATPRRLAGPPPTPRFSHAAATHQPGPPPAPRPSVPRFSHPAQPATAAAALARPATLAPPPAAVFSHAPAAEAAPRRPPTPATPVFSDAPTPAPPSPHRRRIRTRSTPTGSTHIGSTDTKASS